MSEDDENNVMTDADFERALDALREEGNDEVGDLLKLMNESRIISWEEAERIMGDTNTEPVKSSLPAATRPTEPDNDTDVDSTIRKLLQNDPKLVEINLNNMKRTPIPQIKRIIEAMNENTYMEKLSLANMGLYDMDVAPLIDLLENNETIRAINVETNYLSGDFFSKLFRAALKYQSLEEVKCVNQGVAFSTTSEKEIIDAIFQNRGLTKVSINLRLPEGRHKVEQATIRNLEIRRVLRRQAAAEAAKNKPPEPSTSVKKPVVKEFPSTSRAPAILSNAPKAPAGRKWPPEKPTDDEKPLETPPRILVVKEEPEEETIILRRKCSGTKPVKEKAPAPPPVEEKPSPVTTPDKKIPPPTRPKETVQPPMTPTEEVPLPSTQKEKVVQSTTPMEQALPLVTLKEKIPPPTTQNSVDNEKVSPATTNAVGKEKPSSKSPPKTKRVLRKKPSTAASDVAETHAEKPTSSAKPISTTPATSSTNEENAATEPQKPKKKVVRKKKVPPKTLPKPDVNAGTGEMTTVTSPTSPVSKDTQATRLPSASDEPIRVYPRSKFPSTSTSTGSSTTGK